MKCFRNVYNIMLATTLTFLIVCAEGFGQQVGQKQRIPSEAAQKAARLIVQEIYGDDFRAAKTSEQKIQLAQKLMKVAEETTGDPVGRFVLLAKVRVMAAELGNVQLTLTTVDEVSKTFAIESLAWKAESLAVIERGRNLTMPEQRRQFAEAALSLVEQAIAEDQFENASKLVAIASRVARKARYSNLSKQAAQSQREIASLQEEFELVQEARAKLNEDPIDAEANLVVGRYYCFSKADWDVGLLMLAIGSDPQLKKLAGQELQRPESVSEQVAIGDAWWEIAKEMEGRAQHNIKQHAGVWYARALPQLTGLSKAKAEKRLRDAPASQMNPPLAIAPFDQRQARQHQKAWGNYLGVPVEYTNFIGMKFMLIPAGEFLMGSPESEKDRAHTEGPVHQVRISKAFYLGVYEVTQEQYAKVIGVKGSRLKASNNPVRQVSWNDAVEFCQKLSASQGENASGKLYRLPTEAEWENACRSGTATAYSFARDASKLSEFAWYKGSSGNMSHPVGQKRPNGFGLYDMHGNVWEWTNDWHAKDYYGKSPMVDPRGPSTGLGRVYRGGSWSNSARVCRSAIRYWDPTVKRVHNVGFRVVLEIPAEMIAKAKRSNRRTTVRTSSSPISRGLVGHWKFDEGSGNRAVDSVGNAHGKLHGNPTWTRGRIGGALKFDGKDDWVEVGEYPTLERFTVCVWVNIEIRSRESPVFVCLRANVVQQPNRDLNFEIDILGKHTAVELYSHLPNGTGVRVQSNTNLVGTGWHHVAASYDGREYRVYVDGQLENRLTGGPPATRGTQSLSFGAEPIVSSRQRYWHRGKLDDIRIYDRALSDADLRSLYESGRSGNQPVRTRRRGGTD